ncbi:MAG: tRNA guanosine(34) transglycosylase Tgt [Patescibacteria group bacterium]|nr:tRNA guanosine(34) transglycosylase Tgt [Patescibacteria group bacterium]MCL5095456.1 tRNA guanosine(34) transglycosylase Tgt [Patescibacteria group bacterium]
MENFSFKVLKKDHKTQARTGEITTPHGKIKTPAFVAVGTQATVKSLTPPELEKIGTQVFFVNTYHTYLRPGAEVIQKMGGLHQFMNWNGPLMTDSGGFQVFSLARSNWSAATNFSVATPTVVKIDNEGVTFKSHWDGTIHRFTPEKSIKIQQQLGADLILAFDQCAPYPITYEKAHLAMSKTHRWARRCLEAQKQTRGSQQALYGIVQGSVYQDLRIESAKDIGSLPFWGIAVGGMAVGETKKEMQKALDWIMPYFPEEKPRHLLGVGEVDDIFAICERGIDTFDCVMPTRLGRMGQALMKIKKAKFKIDITKARYANDVNPLEKDCGCFTCQNFSRAYLNHLFRVRELLGYRLLTIHNLYFLNHLVEEIREAIEQNQLLELRKKWLI